MVTATLVSYSADDTTVYASYDVEEAAPYGRVEYNVSTPQLDGDGNAKTDAQLAEDLRQALQIERAKNLPSAGPAVVVPETIAL